MIPRPPSSTRSATLFPYTTLFRSRLAIIGVFVREGQMVHRLGLSKAPPLRGRGWGGGYRPCARPISPTAPRMAGKPASLAAPPLQGRGERASRIQYRREPAIDNPPAVKGLDVRVVLHPIAGPDIFQARDTRFLPRPFSPTHNLGDM